MNEVSQSKPIVSVSYFEEMRMAFIYYECGTQGKFVDFVSLSLLSKLFIALVVMPRKLPLSFAVGNSHMESNSSMS